MKRKQLSQHHCSNISAGLTSDTDHLALLDIKASLVDGPFGSLSAWNESLHFCHWPGVVCGNNHQRVTALRLNGHASTGSISPSILNLTFLTQLHLADNNLKGLLPLQIGTLFRLQFLNLTNNSLTGEIPTGLANCSHLDTLLLSHNNFSGGFPSQFGLLSKLTDLVISKNDNNLGGIGPDDDFSFFASLSNVTKLQILSLAGTVPPSLSNCSSLQQLFLAGNQLSGRIPTNFLSHLPQLIYLRLDNNSFTSSFPADVGNLINLAVLIASNNNLTGGIPATLGSCLGLEYVDLSGNSLQGKIPVSLSNLKAIGFLDLSRNNLSRIIPEELQGLVVLERLNLSYNQLEGKVPTKGVFANVTAVSIAGNEGLCGGIPSWHLPACPDTNARVKRLKLSLKWIIVVTAAAIFTVLLLICIIDGLRNSSGDPKTKSCQTLVAKNGFLWVTYKQLFDASDEFAPFNLIGEGKFGSVYRAMLDERPIAVKVMNLEQVGAAGSFRAECEALRTTRHRNLVKMITTCSSIDRSGNDFKAVVLELMPNGSLDSWLHPSPEKEKRYLNLWQRLDAAIDVAHALEYLHHDCQTPIVHCDLKPSNVLLDDQMVSHVSDFGLAKFLSSTIAETVGSDHVSSSTLIVRGTIGYVAPEYGMGCSVSTAGDIYSYGILLLEMITGKRPTDEMFNDNCSLHQLCKRASPDNIQDITDPFLFEESFEERQVKKHRRGCLVSLIEIGVKCCAESPADRMSIHQVIIELGAIKAKIPSAADGRKINNFFLQSEADDVVGMVREQVTN
ncbi:Probable LRR receptor-like serine/threonine-protein kinase At3g47570 [Linum grandiflorum]